MGSCHECVRVAQYMTNDPEMYRDMSPLCSWHLREKNLLMVVEVEREDNKKLRAVLEEVYELVSDALIERDPHP